MIQIVIEVDVTPDSFGLMVTVPDGVSTVEAIGYLELAKKQYVESKHTTVGAIHETPIPDDLSGLDNV